MTNNTASIQSIALASAVASFMAASYLYLSPKEEPPQKIYCKKGSINNLVEVLSNMDRLHDFHNDTFEEAGVLTLTVPIAGKYTSIMTIDPQNIEYFLKGNFKNYLKGPELNSALHELLGNGIFNANGEKWKYQRKTASHIFNVKNFRDDFIGVFVKEMHIMCREILDKKAINLKPVDFHALMYSFTLDSFVYLGFGVQLDTLLKDESVSFATSFDYMQKLGAHRLSNPFMSVQEKLTRLLTPWKMSTQDHIQIIDSFAADVIAQRRKEIENGMKEHRDLLSRFMSTVNEKGEKLNDTELRDTILNFILAGRDTTAQTLSWLFYNLCLHPRVEEKTIQEITDKITEDAELDLPKLYEIISNMSYLHAVFYETLRLYPSVPANQKYALEDDIWPDGTVIKAGYYIGWSSYSQGRCTQIWGPDAKCFKPERWIDESGGLRRETAGKWSAFHVGPRICLGQNLATLEALVCVAMLLRRYKFTLVPGQTIAYDLALTLPMKDGMKVFVEKRL